MKLLDGIEVVEYIQERQQRQIKSFVETPKMVILHDSATQSGSAFLRAKYNYGQEVGVQVDIREISTAELASEIEKHGKDKHVAGIIVQLPLAKPEMTDDVISGIPAHKDIDGLRGQKIFQSATSKGIIWLLAAYNIDLKSKTIAVIGQGRLVGKPLSDTLEQSGFFVIRLDIDSPDIVKILFTADIIISATGKAGLVTSAMVKPGAIVIDAGSPKSELAQDLIERNDITRSPNPGGVGPMTVAALFDNLLIAAGV